MIASTSVATWEVMAIRDELSDTRQVRRAWISTDPTLISGVSISNGRAFAAFQMKISNSGVLPARLIAVGMTLTRAMPTQSEEIDSCALGSKHRRKSSYTTIFPGQTRNYVFSPTIGAVPKDVLIREPMSEDLMVKVCVKYLSGSDPEPHNKIFSYFLSKRPDNASIARPEFDMRYDRVKKDDLIFQYAGFDWENN